MQVIPLNSTGARRITVGLYEFRTYWNQSASMWYMDLYGADGLQISGGLALVPNINILRFDETLVEEIGDLRIVDLTGEQNANSNSLGNSAALAYWPPGEFAQEYPEFTESPLRSINVNIDELFTVA